MGCLLEPAPLSSLPSWFCVSSKVFIPRDRSELVWAWQLNPIPWFLDSLAMKGGLMTWFWTRRHRETCWDGICESFTSPIKRIDAVVSTLSLSSCLEHEYDVRAGAPPCIAKTPSRHPKPVNYLAVASFQKFCYIRKVYPNSSKPWLDLLFVTKAFQIQILKYKWAKIWIDNS